MVFFSVAITTKDELRYALRSAMHSREGRATKDKFVAKHQPCSRLKQVHETLVGVVPLDDIEPDEEAGKNNASEKAAEV